MHYDSAVGIDGVPYFSQRVGENNYLEEGFKKLSEALNWSDKICGLACIKMVVTHYKKESIPTLAELLENGMEIGAYKQGAGWVHNGLVNLAKQYGLDGGRESIGANLSKIAGHLKENKLVIASVSPAFEVGLTYISKNGDRITVGKGGHLVVITHALYQDKDLAGFRLHHPSSEKEYEWPSKEITSPEFDKSFSKAGNIIYLGMK